MRDGCVHTDNPSDQDHYVDHCDEEDLRLNLDDEEVFGDFPGARAALRFVACDSNEKLHPSHQAGLSLLRIKSVVQGLVAEDYDQDRGQAMKSS